MSGKGEKCLKVQQKPGISFWKPYRQSWKIKLSVYLLVWLLSAGCLSIFLTNYSPAIEATSTYYKNNELFLTGTLTYIGSSQGTPVDNLDDGKIHTIYLNAEAERCIAIDPYLTNMSSQTAQGWIEDGYEIQIPYSQTLTVSQPHYYGTGTTTRTATAYYEVTVEDIRTNLIYRPDRNDNYITILCGGGLLLLLYTVFKVVRHD